MTYSPYLSIWPNPSSHRTHKQAQERVQRALNFDDRQSLRTPSAALSRVWIPSPSGAQMVM